MEPNPETLRAQITGLFQAGIAAANPDLAVKRHLRIEGQTLCFGLPCDQRTGRWQNIHLLAFGKAATAMAAAAINLIPSDWLAGKGLVITNDDNVTPVKGCEVIGAGHPLPNAAGLNAAQTLAAKLATTQAGDLVLVLISGGGSALLPYPADGISLADKIATTQNLLACGADIKQINCVRKHLSKLKGGGLAQMAAPADVQALILSDVLGDDLSAIASGPTVADDSRFSDAIDILKSYNLWQQTPPAVQHRLQQGASGLLPETPKPGDPIFLNTDQHLIGSNTISVNAIFDAAKTLGYATQLYNQQLIGEARIVAEQWVEYAKPLLEQITQPTALIAGGETTVTVRGNGLGGRNQELALAFALAAERHELKGGWLFLSGGSDGRDGPTDAAGGIVDPQTLTRIRKAAIDPAAMLDDNNAYQALKAAQDLLLIGATGTNVADLQILLLHPN